jgi:hypothetical protein
MEGGPERTLLKRAWNHGTCQLSNPSADQRESPQNITEWKDQKGCSIEFANVPAQRRLSIGLGLGALLRTFLKRIRLAATVLDSDGLEQTNALYLDVS